MLCGTIVSQAAHAWGRPQVGQRVVPALIKSSQLQTRVHGSDLKPDDRVCRAAPRSFASATPGRVYSNFHVYKTRGAMAVQLLPPVFTTENGYKTLDRDGAMLLEFANANPGQQPMSGPPPAGGINRTYNWSNKIIFALSPVELGVILAGDALSTDKGLVLFHDPAKTGKTAEPVKRLVLKQMPDGAISFSLNAGPDSVSVPVSKGEFEVFKSLAHFAIPRLLGFDAIFQ